MAYLPVMTRNGWLGFIAEYIRSCPFRGRYLYACERRRASRSGAVMPSNVNAAEFE
jgi:hypothetical protein